ncbi:hypothetical protein ACER0A_007965 [Haloimpatiens sp. FM7315]|uniref:hypothetical protein n=1 Tax=Haloimpatiens sp. FM7315 TaxID=3298609 RepID=UPI0035A30870
MEFRLNKIDTELRQKIKDTTKPGKIHRKNEIKVSDDKNKKFSRDKDFAYKLKKAKDNKKKVVVEGYKADNLDVEAFKDGIQYEGENRGIFIDTKK